MLCAVGGRRSVGTEFVPHHVTQDERGEQRRQQQRQQRWWEWGWGWSERHDGDVPTQEEEDGGRRRGVVVVVVWNVFPRRLSIPVHHEPHEPHEHHHEHHQQQQQPHTQQQTQQTIESPRRDGVGIGVAHFERIRAISAKPPSPRTARNAETFSCWYGIYLFCFFVLGDLFFLFGRSMKWGYISMCNKQGTRIGNDRKRSKKDMGH